MTTQQIENPYGIVFVDEAPPAPISRDRDDERWQMVKLILAQAPDKWAAVKDYDKKGSAPAKASQINGDKFKTLPATEYEARATTDKETSVLFLRLRTEDEQNKLKAAAAKAEATAEAVKAASKPETNEAPTMQDVTENKNDATPPAKKAAASNK